MRLRTVVTWALCALLAAATARADEGDLELARKRFEMGKLLHERGRYKEALVELEAARALVPRPEFDYNIGLCLARLDRPVEAADALERFVRARPGDPEAAAIWSRIAALRAEGLRRKGETRDDAAPKAAAPNGPPAGAAPNGPPAGAAPNGPPAGATTNAPPAGATPNGPPAGATPNGPLAGATPNGPLPTVPPPAPGEIAPAAPPAVRAPRPRFLATAQGRATIGLAAGAGALLLTAVVTGSLALDGRSSYDAGCDRGLCDPSAYDRMHALAITTDVLIGLGSAAAIAAVVLVATRPRERALSLVPLVGAAHGLAVQGTF